LYKDEKVIGVATDDKGINKKGELKDTFTRGIALEATQTMISEGCRGSLAENLISKYKLRNGKDPQI